MHSRLKTCTQPIFVTPDTFLDAVKPSHVQYSTQDSNSKKTILKTKYTNAKYKVWSLSIPSIHHSPPSTLYQSIFETANTDSVPDGWEVGVALHLIDPTLFWQRMINQKHENCLYQKNNMLPVVTILIHKRQQKFTQASSSVVEIFSATRHSWSDRSLSGSQSLMVSWLDWCDSGEWWHLTHLPRLSMIFETLSKWH